MIVKYILAIFVGFGAGVIISGAIFAFIAILGAIPRMAQKTDTRKFLMLYEEFIIAGGFLGFLTGVFDINLKIGSVGAIIVGFVGGVFYGCLAMSLAEVLNAMPILKRRSGLQKGVRAILLILAVAKFIGSLMYFFIPGFLSIN